PQHYFNSIFTIPNVITFYLFSHNSDHRELHSFPTRRSSDLSNNRAGWKTTTDSFIFNFTDGKNISTAKLGYVNVNNARKIFFPRSEEHTSELQSLRHLVCRLLLEKKKNTLRRKI